MEHLLAGRCTLMMGPAGSGKSTLAAALAAMTGAAVVSYDHHQRQTPGDTGIEPVGEQALTAARQELAERCATGTAVIVDGTHCQPERRAAARAIASAHGMTTVVVVLMVPLDLCLQRQALRERRVPAADIARQHAAIGTAVPELAEEGHAAVVLLGAEAADRLCGEAGSRARGSA